MKLERILSDYSKEVKKTSDIDPRSPTYLARVVSMVGMASDHIDKDLYEKGDIVPIRKLLDGRFRIPFLTRTVGYRDNYEIICKL